jgi:hypothetical protein
MRGLGGGHSLQDTRIIRHVHLKEFAAEFSRMRLAQCLVHLE